MAATITFEIPEHIHIRLLNTAEITQKPLNEIILRVLQVGSPPAWDGAPPEFQPNLAVLAHVVDGALRQIARSAKNRSRVRTL
ncbi:hypothetical protein PN498_18980 [Oscillatoria sp. CS-180]|uniref:hypothetical protein n=1 Tax=Oscillatoria sp. CS-180 TaxID=3021720 RepID=UPI00232C44CF|nr:hypothetical protein [Oscillatoria sp. CS-180]MDB9528086.1 hypothetical protein [Oscillatoria sp. CS-180]